MELSLICSLQCMDLSCTQNAIKIQTDVENFIVRTSSALLYMPTCSAMF